MQFEVVFGTDGLTTDDVAHVLVPGRGRNGSGFGLSDEGMDRVIVAHLFYESIARSRRGGIVCSGYKSPVDLNGTKWSPSDSPAEVFCGMPEADLMKATLVNLGVDEEDVKVERHSIDTATNFLRSELEGHFGDNKPVAVIAQAAHLRRMLSVIAPRTLRRPYLGVVVGEADVTDESVFANLVSRAVLAALPSDPQRAISVAERRVRYMWGAARALGVRQYHETGTYRSD